MRGDNVLHSNDARGVCVCVRVRVRVRVRVLAEWVASVYVLEFGVRTHVRRLQDAHCLLKKNSLCSPPRTYARCNRLRSISDSLTHFAFFLHSLTHSLTQGHSSFTHAPKHKADSGIRSPCRRCACPGTRQ